MLAYLKGVVIFRDLKGRIILDVQGVGYEIFIPSNQISSIKLDDVAEFWIYSHIREDVFSLYGFFLEKEKKVFSSLLSINGVGPKLALSILSSCEFEQLIDWIESENVESLCRLPKVGRKKAQTMILSLKGKWPAMEISKKDNSKIYNEISSGLLRLGFRSSEIKQVLSQMENQKDVQEGIRRALGILQNL